MHLPRGKQSAVDLAKSICCCLFSTSELNTELKLAIVMLIELCPAMFFGKMLQILHNPIPKRQNEKEKKKTLKNGKKLKMDCSFEFEIERFISYIATG